MIQPSPSHKAIIILLILLISMVYSANIPRLLFERNKNKPNAYARLTTSKAIKKSLNKSPIILVGGLGGSALMSERKNAKEPHWWCSDKTEPFQLWASLNEMIPFVTEECLSHDLSLEMKTFNGSIRGLKQKDEGVLIYGKDYGGLNGVNYITNFEVQDGAYMHELTNYLINEGGYIAGKNLRALPYDWRLGPLEWMVSTQPIGGDFEKFKALIEQTFRWNDNTAVSLLGHSLGGPFIQLFLASYVDEAWKAKYVKQMISISGSFDGDVHSPIFYTAGDNYGLSFFLEKTAKELIHGFGSPQYMSPLVSPYKYPMFIYKNNATGKVLSYMSTPDEYRRLYQDANVPQGWDIFTNELNAVKDVKFKSPNVTMHCIFGTDVWATTQYKYEGAKDLQDLVYSDVKDSGWEKGDGTIPNYSLELCSNFKQDRPIFTHKFINSTHINIMFEEKLFSLVLEIV